MSAADRVLREVFGYDTFRPGQQEIIDHVVAVDGDVQGGRRPALLRLHPWYAEPSDEQAQISDFARQCWGGQSPGVCDDG